MTARWFIAGWFLALLPFTPGRAAVVIHDYVLQGTLSPEGGGPSLTMIGGTLTELGYVFADKPVGIGASFELPSDVSFEISFAFKVPSGDLTPSETSVGMILNSMVISNALAFQPAPLSSPLSTPHEAYVHLVLTQNAAGETKGYVNGESKFVISRNTPPSFFLSGFIFSLQDPSNELAALDGRVNFVRIYDGVLSGSELSDVVAAAPPLAIPEPSTYVLLGAGLAALFYGRKRRNKVSSVFNKSVPH